MLTDSEKQWLEQRGCRTRKMPLYVNEYHKSLCMRRKELQRQCADLFNEFEYRTEALADYTKAAFFEAKVAEKLATYAAMMVGSDIAAPCLECPCKKAGVCYDGTNKSCQWSFLTTARLAVEEEYDAD